jgi:hypothetical protein
VRLTKILLVLLSMAAALPAVAGTRQAIVATVHSAEGWGMAAVGQTRRSDGTRDGSQLGCESYAAAGWIYCFVRGGPDGYDYCLTSSSTPPSFIKNAYAINSASFVAIYWDPVTHVCADMRLIQGSQFLPDAHLPVVRETVAVNPTSAQGSLSAVRYNGANPNEFISCDVWASGYIYCMARDNANNVAACSMREEDNPLLADVVRSIDAMTKLEFHFNSAGTCVNILVHKDTLYLP